MVASHLRRAIPPGSTPRDALISLGGTHPFPDIGPHVVQAIHTGLRGANAGGADAATDPGGTIES